MTGENPRSLVTRAGAWLLAGLWTALVLTASGDAFSADATRGAVFEFWSWLGVSRADAAPFVFWTRKGAHFIEYGVLGLLVLRALRLTGVRLGTAAACTLLWALAVAFGDEAHQAYLSTRTGSLRDVVIDMSGATLAVALSARLLVGRKTP
ncbi:MAG: VanZ family protein [Myxococcales bacterium]|nr:VanZ family protein [Myxococcales bacterium]